MESDGPYTIKNKNYWWNVDGLGEEQRLNQWAYKIGAEWWASKLNAAHAEGRKAREKELEELLEFVNRIMEFFRRHTYCPSCKSDIDHTFECEVENAADSVLINFSRKCIDDFYVWKQARGIE